MSDATGGMQAAILRTLLASSGEAVVVRDLRGEVVEWSRGAERMYGYSAEEVVGKDPSLLMPPAHSLEATAIVDRVMRGEQVENLETERMTKDGRILQVSVNASPVMDGGRSSDPED